RLENMKLVIFAALLAVAACRPQDEVEVNIVREESDLVDGFNFRHEFELDNGVAQSLVGSADEAGAQVITGSYTLPLPEGGFATVTFVANALGFSAESPLLPVAPINPHPIPAHAQEQIDFSIAQQAAGLVWDQGVHAWV
ncbi:unnamed protein product, partial [Meganyctiphanes norvegica]